MTAQRVKIERVCVSTEQLPRPGLPEVSVIGRSNVGKSTLINRVLGVGKILRVSRTPGRTQAVIFVDVNGSGYLVDLPGYGYAKVPLAVKRSWRSLVETYLARRAVGMGVLLVDIRRDAEEEEKRMVEWFRYYGRPFSVVMTKADKLPRGRWKARARVLAGELLLEGNEEPIPFSAVTGEGVKTLRLIVKKSME